jgi:hypothetical protein
MHGQEQHVGNNTVGGLYGDGGQEEHAGNNTVGGLYGDGGQTGS